MPTSVTSPDTEPGLVRSLSLWLLILYGLGNILGAGIYVLIGRVVGVAGIFTPWAFLLASVIAGLTAFSYAELSARYPLSAGEAVYLQAGFGVRQLSCAVGLLIVVAGIVSAAAIARGFVGYFQQFVVVPGAPVIVLLVSMLTLLAIWGIVESVRVAALFTLIEIFGLLLLVAVAIPDLGTLGASLESIAAPADHGHWHGILLGAILAFYAYIGFEDMVNVAEEVRDPLRNMPRAIIVALVVSTLLYMAVALVALASGPLEQLAQSDAPLALVYERAMGTAPVAISLIAMVAVVNGALIQIIMASRVVYGLARQGWLPGLLGRVGERTHTPMIATALAGSAVLVMALWLPLETLARVTSLLLLVVFALVNLALMKIKRAAKEEYSGFSIPPWLPFCGLVSASALLGYQLLAALVQ